jgi:hypothetical protein
MCGWLEARGCVNRICNEMTCAHQIEVLINGSGELTKLPESLEKE